MVYSLQATCKETSLISVWREHKEKTDPPKPRQCLPSIAQEHSSARASGGRKGESKDKACLQSTDTSFQQLELWELNYSPL